jgi:uncharacterized protein
VSAGNIDIVRRGLDAYNDHDADRLLEVSDPEIEFVPLRSLVVGGSYRGHEGIRRFLEDVAEEWEDLVIQPDEFRERGDQVVMLGFFQARGRASGVETRAPVAWLFELHDRKVVRMRAYSDQTEALAALGGSGRGPGGIGPEPSLGGTLL